MSKYDEMEEMYEILEMEDEDGEIVSFFVIDSLELEEATYFLVIDADESIDYDAEVTSYIFKGLDADGDDGDDLILEMLDEGEEYDEVAKLFDEAEEQNLDD